MLIFNEPNQRRRKERKKESSNNKQTDTIQMNEEMKKLIHRRFIYI